MNVYQNYHCHKYFTNPIVPDSPTSIEDYAKKVKELGHSVLCSMEHAWQGNYWLTYKIAKEYGLKFIFGTEAYWVKNRFEKDGTNCHIVILAKSEKGRRAINLALSEANITGYYKRPRLDLELIFNLPAEDVFITSACIAGWNYEDMDDLVIKFHNYFKSNYLLEVQYHNTDSQKELNTHILELSKKHNIDIIAGMDSHYVEENGAWKRDNILEYKGIKYENEEGWYLDYVDYDTAMKRFEVQGVLSTDEIKKALDNTNKILEFDNIEFDNDIKLPTIYPNLTQEEKNNKLKSILNKEWKVYRQLENIKQEEFKEYQNGVKEEFDEIVKTNMADYFLLNYEIIKSGKKKGGLITKRGRGSAPSFFMNTLLGFSKVDRFKTPIKLYPERFLTADRILKSKSLPDIDFNLYDVDKFAESQREILGEHSAYPMIAFGTLKTSAAFKWYAGANNIEPSIANEITSQIKEYEKALKYAEEDDKEDILLSDYVDKKYLTYIENSKEYLGIVVDKKAHPCGWVLLNGDIREYIGVLRCESESSGKSVLTACIDGAMCEFFKFLKNDLLKVDVVGLTTKVWNRVGITEPTNNQLEELVKNDEETWDIYAKGYTMCVNQVEKEKTKLKAMRYRIRNTAELSAFVASVRPAFASLLDNFLDRKGYTTGVKELDEVLKDSFHYMLYQESIMGYLNWLGIDNKETYDILKKIAKKKFKGDELIKLKSKLHENWILHVGDENGFEESWKVVEDASAYAFNCSHSYCVGNDGLELAYLKAHYPYEFYEVCLNEYDKKAKKDKILLLKQEMLEAFDIKEGEYKFGLDNRQFTLDKENKCINPSISSIKGIGKKVAESLYEMGKFKYADFIEILDTCKKYSIDKGIIETLIKLNYFKEYGNPNQLIEITKLYDFWKDRKEITKSKYNGDIEFLADKGKVTEKKIMNLNGNSILIEISKKVNVKTSVRELIQYQYETLGYSNLKYPKYIDKALVIEIDTTYSPKIKLFKIDTGEEVVYKVYKNTYSKNPIEKYDVIEIGTLGLKPKSKKVNGDWIKTEEKETWMEGYKKLNSN